MLLQIALIEEVGMKEGHSLSIAVLVILVIDNLLIQLLTLYEAHVNGSQLLADYLLLYDDFRGAGEEEKAD